MVAAITGSAIAEASLERLLVSKFQNRDANLIGQLFKNRGPLMDLHSKILIAHAFGLITAPMAEEFHSVKAIRNAFAHSKMPLDFEHEIIGREVRSLRMGAAIRAVPGGHSSMKNRPNRWWFQLTIRLLLVLLDVLQKSKLDAKTTLSDPSAKGDPEPKSSPKK